MATGAIRLQVLGPLQIQVAAVDAVVNGDRKHRLLARLALTPSRDVSVDSLISAMWGDHAPRTAKQSVHVHISHIREKLRPLEADQLITTTASGAYRLGIDRDDIDASRFESLIDAGLLAYRSNNARHARDVLRDAVELWAEPYPSLADHPGAIAERQRLTALHESAIDALCAALLELDEQTSAVPLLRQVLAHDPLRERPYAQLVSAYMAIGELGAAQGVLKHAEQVFHDALGIAPSNELQSLLHGIEDRRPNTGTRAPTSVEFTVGNGERIDVARSLFMRVDPGADLRGLEDEVSALAGGQERRVAWGPCQYDQPGCTLVAARRAGRSRVRAPATGRSRVRPLHTPSVDRCARRTVLCWLRSRRRGNRARGRGARRLPHP